MGPAGLGVSAVLLKVDHKTVKRSWSALSGARSAVVRRPVARLHNYDDVTELVRRRVAQTRPRGRITAKRLLPVARAAGYDGSARNFRRVVAEAKVDYHRSRADLSPVASGAG